MSAPIYYHDHSGDTECYACEVAADEYGNRVEERAATLIADSGNDIETIARIAARFLIEEEIADAKAAQQQVSI